MATPVQMPKQGNTVEECLIVDWKVKEGDTVAEGDILCGIETDKATFDVESTAAGTVLKLFWGEGDLVPVLQNIAVVGDPGEDVSAFSPEGGGAAAPAESAAPAEAAPAAGEQAAAPAAAPVARADGEFVAVSPRARMEAARLGIDPAQVAGTGAKGRVISVDIEAAAASGLRMTPAAQSAAAATGQVAGAGTGVGGRVRAGDLVAPGAAAPAAAAAPVVGEVAPTETPYRGIRKLIGDRMLESLLGHAQLTMNNSADATAIMAFRKKVKAQAEALGLPNITLNDMVAFVVARTLPRFPELNCLFDKAAEKIYQYANVHLAMAVDTERGLMVPVMRCAEQMSLGQLSLVIRDLAGQCRGGSIDPDMLQGGTFTITNLGAMGVESFTPVLNSPQVAILGVCSIEQKPVPDGNGGVKFQPTMGLSLTIDHQVVDGAPAARFLQAVADGIANFELMLAQ